ncbi:HepT-like ribonuclease domain-containing protein [Defluviicoccus vanus]|uniref:DUF86 domain-containing protein n=1 Tax=Defluviicoccus vanus TaxID=111831 RepID=A0A7H1N4E4_9PROT|nr:HepT-like ribonuclease domain-containing protein [Defluviicoccus vanus]QNT70580.1 DUF86 domain-containing protein [Defluviicoccus vanus]
MSLPRDPKAFLWDAREAARAALRFAADRTFGDYLSDELLRSAIERQLQIVGEALAQLSRADAQTAERIPHLRQIIAFRNILVHGYAAVDHENVWQIVGKHLPSLIETLGTLLEDK